MPKKNTASNDNELVLKAYLSGNKVMLKTTSPANLLIPVITALIIHCTRDMLSKEKVLDKEDDVSNFLLGAYLLTNRAYQDAVHDKVTSDDMPDDKEVSFL